MIRLYMMPEAQASSKAKNWLIRQGIVFEEINLLNDQDSLKEHLFEVLPLLEEGPLEMISSRGQRYKTLKKKMGELSLSQLIDYLVAEPQLIRHPILFDGKRVQIGFKPEEIRVFIPSQVRRVKFQVITERMRMGDNVNVFDTAKLGAIDR